MKGRPLIESLLTHLGGKTPPDPSLKRGADSCAKERVKMTQLSLSSYKLSFKEHQIQNHTKTFLEVKVSIRLEI
jgi:hypothetical protein